jgi:CHAD domain-containing protein
MDESPSFRLDAGEPLPAGIRRIARGRIDHALDELRGETDSTPAEAVHEARKDMKKLRALLLLVRNELGGARFARETACFRDAARELSGVRDADVIRETLVSLDLPPGVGWELRRAVQAHHWPDDSGGREAAARGVIAMLSEARARVGDWPLERDSFDAVADGLVRTYRRGRRDLRAVRREPDTKALHDWRKRVKHLWYQHSLLRCLWPPVMCAVADEAHALSSLLGEDHDLAVLSEWAELNADAPAEFFEVADARRSALQQEALAMGARLYAERPATYVGRLERLWATRGTEVRAP